MPDTNDLDGGDAPKLKPIIDPETVIIQNSAERNSMLCGAINTVDRTSHHVTYVPRRCFTEDPPQTFISISSWPLPMPHDLKSWYVLKDLLTGAALDYLAHDLENDSVWFNCAEFASWHDLNGKKILSIFTSDARGQSLNIKVNDEPP